ncbi:MAG TPA: DUF3600 domain-containing protein [Bacilli bacterium]|nr:DUF3600 domain-containing protein [Bacilli bacterium]
MKKKMIAMLVAGTLLIPTSVLAANYLADNVYGSYHEMKDRYADTTPQDYQRFNDKLEAAKQTLGDEEYLQFETLLKRMVDFQMQYGDATGQIDESTLTREQDKEWKDILKQIEPYFEKLNGDL